ATSKIHRMAGLGSRRPAKSGRYRLPRSPHGGEMRTIQGIAAGLFLLALAGTAAAAQPAAAAGAAPAGQDAARAERFDPEAATEAYLARLSPQERARSDAYFEGGYWLLLWGFLYGLAVFW